MNMEYWIGVVHVVNGISFFGMFFGFGAAGISMLIAVESPSKVKENVKLYRLAAVAVAVLDKELNGYLDEYLTPTQPNTDTPKQ